MGGVGQHANIYGVIPFVLVFLACIGIMPAFADVFSTFVRATKFRPHVYVPDELEAMTPVGYFGGLFDTLVWFEGSFGKLAFARLVVNYAFMSCIACDEVSGPTAKFKATIMYILKGDKHGSAISGIAGNSIWVYSLLFEMLMAVVSSSYVRMAGAVTGGCLGYALQMSFLKPIWSGRGIQNCLTRLRSGMSYCLGDAFYGGRRLVLRVLTTVILLTYLVSGQFDSMVVYILIAIASISSDRSLISLMGFMGGNWTLFFVGLTSGDPLISAAEDNSQLNMGTGVEAGANAGEEVPLISQ